MVRDDKQSKISHVITESGPYGGAQRNTFLAVKASIQDPNGSVCADQYRI